MSAEPTLEEKMTEYQKVLRKKIGEFMLVINDLLERNVNAHPTLGNVRRLEEITQIISAGNKTSTSTWAGDPEISLLMTLLYNNGYPFQLHNTIAQSVAQGQTPSGTVKYPEDKYFDREALYKSYIIFGNLQGDSTTNPNHYTMELPFNLIHKIDLPVGVTEIGGTDSSAKIQIPGDGHCFYKAFSIWCMTYGVTIEHLENISYNVPFQFDEVAHKQNFKVDLTDYTDASVEKIPNPMPIPDKFEDLVDIANSMLKKVKTLEPNFGDFQDITESDEYKDYVQNGISKDDGTHCNKYKGNKGNKEAAVGE